MSRVGASSQRNTVGIENYIFSEIQAERCSLWGYWLEIYLDFPELPSNWYEEQFLRENFRKTVRHEEDDLHPFRTDKVNSGVKPHSSPFPLPIALNRSRKHRPETSLCKKPRPKSCIISLESPATQLGLYLESFLIVLLSRQPLWYGFALPNSEDQVQICSISNLRPIFLNWVEFLSKILWLSRDRLGYWQVSPLRAH